ncbi:MAG: methyltransferase RsmF C-terminal domain-like protein [Nanobdellota archaeon]
MELDILNSREVKKISAHFQERFGFSLDRDKAYLMSKKGKLYMAEKSFSEVLDKKVNIESIGLYIAHVSNGQVRLSIDGSQYFGDMATKNVILLDKESRRSWLRGEELSVSEDMDGPFIMKEGEDYLGTGIAKEGRLINYVPKERRVRLSS